MQEGHVRFEKEGEASRAAAKLAENKTELGGKVPTIAVLEGDANANRLGLPRATLAPVARMRFRTVTSRLECMRREVQRVFTSSSEGGCN
jgi:hypothetical protein